MHKQAQINRSKHDWYKYTLPRTTYSLIQHHDTFSSAVHCSCSLWKLSTTLTCKSLLQLGSGGHVHRALAVTVEQGRVSPVAQQQRANLHSVFRRGFVEGGELPQIHGVNTRSMLKEGRGRRDRSTEERLHLQKKITLLRSSFEFI